MEQHAVDAGLTLSRGRQAATFGRHFAEMCAPMCIGFAIGDLIYFGIASWLGYSEPFREFPQLSVVLVTLFMTIPMVAWMLWRGMPQKATAEMAAPMVVLAFGLLAAGGVGLMPTADMALAEHGLMMPAMLVPMLFRLDLYTGRSGHVMGHGAAR